jgi:hypothetical protein
MDERNPTGDDYSPKPAGSSKAPRKSSFSETYGLVKGAALEPDLQAHIGRHLRSVYEEVVKEAIPDRFLRLLEELEKKQGTEK